MAITSLIPKLMKKICDKDLVEGLQNPATNEDLQVLQSEFFVRYRGFVFSAASNRTRYFTEADQLAKDITQEVFRNVFKKRKKKFKLPDNAPEQQHEYIIKGWLGKIVNNEFNKELARLKGEETLDEVLSYLPEPSFDLFEELYPGPEPVVTNPLMIRLQQALDTISKDRDKHILQEYAREDCIETGKHLSENTMSYLCKLYDTTPENIRQIKKRTLAKIKQACFD